MDKVFAKIDKTKGCWNWTGSLNKKGYGEAVFEGKKYKVHRLIYTFCGNIIPQGLELDHLCRNRKCVNPNHLEPVSHLENIRRGLPFRKKKTHCKKGHEFTADNTIYLMRKNGKGNRVCRTCKKESQKKYMVGNY